MRVSQCIPSRHRRTDHNTLFLPTVTVKFEHPSAQDNMPIQLIDDVVCEILSHFDYPVQRATGSRRLIESARVFDLLRVCSLVCRRWCAIAQSLLFRKVYMCRILYVRTLPSFIKFLRSSPHIATLITELHIDGALFSAMLRDDWLNIDTSTLYEALQVLPNLWHLDMRRFKLTCVCKTGRIGMQHGNRRKMKQLSFSDVLPEPDDGSFAAIADVVHMFSAIGVLRISFVRVNPHHLPKAAGSGHQYRNMTLRNYGNPNVDALHITHRSAGFAVIFGPRGCVDTRSLRTITVNCLSRIDVDRTGIILVMSKAELVEIKFSMPLWHGFNIGGQSLVQLRVFSLDLMWSLLPM